MVGSGIKKFASQNGLTVKEGVAYGNYHGYMLTMQEGSGWKALAYAVKADTAQRVAIQDYLGGADIKKTYRITDILIEENLVLVKVQDTIGTMKLFEQLAEVLVAFLGSQSIPGASICSHCGTEGASVPVLAPSGVVLPMHGGCADILNTSVAEQKEEANAKSNGVLVGAVGALIGGIIGAIPWAVAYYFGWFVAALGLLIGFAAGKGYDLLRGKQCKAKAVVIIVVIIACVILAELVACVFQVQSIYNEEYGLELTIAQSIDVFKLMAEVSPEVGESIVGDILIGLLFAALGAWADIAAIFKANSKRAAYRKLD